MKKIMTFVMAMALASVFSFTNLAQADPYGRVTISGIAKSGENFVVLASAFEGGGEASGCALNDWWLIGTNYAFWLPMTGNEDLYVDISSAYYAGKKLWIDATYESLAYAAGVPCKIRIADKPITISDFED
ncbi:hypothetical protein ACFL3M_01550 [Patescibacteria group bacterium]